MSLAMLALICLLVSVVLAIVNNDFKSSSLWALWAIACAIILGSMRFG